MLFLVASKTPRITVGNVCSLSMVKELMFRVYSKADIVLKLQLLLFRPFFFFLSYIRIYLGPKHGTSLTN